MNSIFFFITLVSHFVCLMYELICLRTHTTHEGPFFGVSELSFVFNTQLLSRLVKLGVY